MRTLALLLLAAAPAAAALEAAPRRVAVPLSGIVLFAQKLNAARSEGPLRAPRRVSADEREHALARASLAARDAERELIAAAVPEEEVAAVSDGVVYGPALHEWELRAAVRRLGDAYREAFGEPVYPARSPLGPAQALALAYAAADELAGLGLKRVRLPDPVVFPR